MKLPFTRKPKKMPVFERPEYSENANLVGKNCYYSFEETQNNPNYQGKTGESDGGADQNRTGDLLTASHASSAPSLSLFVYCNAREMRIRGKAFLD